jgi:hypothetical protein
LQAATGWLGRLRSFFEHMFDYPTTAVQQTAPEQHFLYLRMDTVCPQIRDGGLTTAPRSRARIVTVP